MINLKNALNAALYISILALLLYCSISLAALPINELPQCASFEHRESTTHCIEDQDSIFKSEPDTNQTDNINTKEEIIKYFSNEPWAKKNRLPLIGLAMSGGGSKSAPFVMGVMKRFAENEWMNNTDVISSVSGGGYSAYYFYKKMWMIKNYPEYLEEYKNSEDYKKGIKSLPGQKEIFADIRAEKYGEMPKQKDCVLNTNTNLTRCNVVTEDLRNFGYLPRDSRDCSKFELNSTRHQAYIECYQDVLSIFPGGASKTNTLPPIPAYAAMLGTTIISLPFHHIANSLFDWKLPISPTQMIYKRGIKRTYGNTPDDKTDLISTGIIPTKDDFDFNALMSLYKECDECGHLPWWVINMTNQVEDKNKRYLNKTIFELTANSMGSGNYGYLFGYNLSDLLPSYRPIDAVTASGAFFDSLSAYQPYDLSGKTVFFLLHAFNARWGIDVPNYRVSNNVRTLHSFIPWPFYYTHRFDRKPNSAYIRLADGGQSGENLGIYSLLRRGTRNIVVADGAYDFNKDHNSSELPELCLTNQFLNTNGLEIVFRGRPNELPKENDSDTHLSAICDENGSAGPKVKTDELGSFSPYKWKRAIWVGHITPLDKATLPKGFEILKDVKIFYIKSAVDYALLESELKSLQDDKSVCDGDLNHIQGTLTKNGMPCTLLGYVIDSGNYRIDEQDGIKIKDLTGKIVWPQTQTVGDTADGSANKFTAYRDLGWYAARNLTCLMNADGVNKKIEDLDLCINSSSEKTKLD